MKRIAPARAALALALILTRDSRAGGDVSDHASLVEATRMLSIARQAEARGDCAVAAEKYRTTLSYAQTAFTVPTLSTATVAGASLGNIARHELACRLTLARERLAAPRNDLEAEQVRTDLATAYGRLSMIEPASPTWPYLAAVMDAAANDYRAAAIKLQTCLAMSGGEASVKRKAQTLLDHIAPAAAEQQKMYDSDWQAYRDYVASGQQARDMLRGLLQYDAQQAERNQDFGKASRLRQRAQEIR